MKRILLGALGMLSALAFTETPTRPARVAGGQRGASKTWRNTGRPNAARHWHTGQGVQIDRIDDAQEKRAYRAEKLHLQTLGAWNNAAHVITHPAPEGSTYRAFVPTLNPFYVAK